MKKVLHILNELKPSGAEVMLNSSKKYWDLEGYQCEILSTGDSLGEYSGNLGRSGYVIHHIKFGKKLRFFKMVYDLLKNNKYDIVHIHTERANFIYALVCKLARVTTVVRTVHSCFSFTGIARKRRKLERYILNKLQIKQISISPSVYESEKKYFNNETKIILNWYDSDKFIPINNIERLNYRENFISEKSPFLLVSVGNCSTIKNHSEIISAISSLSPEKDIKYIHIGQEESNCSERQLVKKLNLEDKVEFLGYKQDVRPYLWMSDAFIMPSLYEGLGNAALEAIAAGTNCILSDTQGLRDLKQYSENIKWVEPKAISIANAITELMEEPREIRQTKAYEDAYRLKEYFGISRGVKEYIKFYN